jgi:hypothetical protein
MRGAVGVFLAIALSSAFGQLVGTLIDAPRIWNDHDLAELGHSGRGAQRPPRSLLREGILFWSGCRMGAYLPRLLPRTRTRRVLGHATKC